jgi:hypothetical protein
MLSPLKWAKVLLTRCAVVEVLLSTVVLLLGPLYLLHVCSAVRFKPGQRLADGLGSSQCASPACCPAEGACFPAEGAGSSLWRVKPAGVVWCGVMDSNMGGGKC